MNHRNAERKFLFPSQRHIPHIHLLRLFESQALQHRLSFLSYLLVIQAIDSAKEFDILSHFQVRIERKALAHIADMLFNILLSGPYVEACDSPLSRSRTAQSAKNPHRCRLSGPVRPEKTKNLTLCHIKRNVVNGSEVSEFLRKSPHANAFFFINRLHHISFYTSAD